MFIKRERRYSTLWKRVINSQQMSHKIKCQLKCYSTLSSFKSICYSLNKSGSLSKPQTFFSVADSKDYELYSTQTKHKAKQITKQK